MKICITGKADLLPKTKIYVAFVNCYLNLGFYLFFLTNSFIDRYACDASSNQDWKSKIAAYLSIETHFLKHPEIIRTYFI